MFIWHHHWKWPGVSNKQGKSKKTDLQEWSVDYQGKKSLTNQRWRCSCPVQWSFQNNNILGSDPAHPVEHAQSCDEVSRDLTPNEASSHGDPKEALAGHVTLVAVSVVLMQGIEEGTTGHSTRPDHSWWPDNKLTEDSSKAEPNALRTNGKEDLEGHGDGLAI